MPQILSGSYDGVVRTYNALGQVEKQYVASAPVRAVQWIYGHRIALAGNDRQVRLWKTAANDNNDNNDTNDNNDNDNDTESGRTLAILDAHKALWLDFL